MRIAALLFLVLFISISCLAQQQMHTGYTTSDGLPSNNVYRCIEDDRGFLWVATDAGIARFDGKRFQVFTTKDGLPDNEVLAVVKEKNGRIWVNCFKQKPAYFDEIKNRFINAKDDTSLAKVPEGTSLMHFFLPENGGIMFTNEKGSFIYRNGRLVAYTGFLIREIKGGANLIYGERPVDWPTKVWQAKIFQKRGVKCLDSAVLKVIRPVDYIVVGQNEGKIYLVNYNAGKCFIYSDIRTHPLRFRMDSVVTPERLNNFEFTQHSFYLSGISGNIYLYDKTTLRPQPGINATYLTNSIYKDNGGNLWLCTIDKGVLLFKKKTFDTVAMPKGFGNTYFLSIARKADGTILAGNFYGEVLASKGEKVSVHTITKTGLIARQRKILISSNKTFTFSEAGICSDYKTNLGIPAKSAAVYNDSIIIVAQSYGLIKLNTQTGKIKILNSLRRRVTAVSNGTNGWVYFGSTDGLYKYNYDRNVTVPWGQADPLLRERITALCITPGGLLWVATAGSGLLVMKDEKVLYHITERQGLISNATRSMSTGKQNQVWLGTTGGISVINYLLQKSRLTYNVQNLTVNDGLTSNTINEMICQHDTVYAATANGITIIPANVSIPKYNIPVQLIHLSVNQRDTVLSAFYKLGYNQRNIQMEFAGIELGGHFKNLQYTLDKNKDWVNLDENVLAVELSSGKHAVQVRAVDVNGNISNKILTTNFDITTPYWKAIWFWILIAIEIQLIILFFLNSWQKKRREDKLAKEIAGVQIASLEQQAFTSLMNPHFIFNALNSIQHYINLQDRQNANRYLSDFASLIRKSFEAAQQSFIPLEQEIENIKIYLRLEQMRFNERFSYRVLVVENVDTEDWMIPTMILQPLLENALLHGIVPSSIPGELEISVEDRDENLCIIITDNGIGIANSRALKDPNDRHKSRGMELIEKRIAALSRFGSSPVTISISPAFDSEKNPGNRITLCVPYGLHQAWLLVQR